MLETNESTMSMLTVDSVVDQAAETIKLERAEFAALIEQIKRASKDSALAVAKALLKAIYFSIEAKDPRPATALIGAVRVSTKQTGMVAVLEQFGNLAYMKSGKNKHFAFFDAGREWDDAYRTEAKEACRNWETFKPLPAGPKALDVLDSLISLLKRVDRELDAGRDVGHLSMVEDLRAMVGRETANDLDW